MRFLSAAVIALMGGALLVGCVASEGDRDTSPAPMTSPTQQPAGEGVLTLEGACAIVAAIAQGLEAAERLPADQLDAAGRDAVLKVVGIQIVQAATAYTGEFDDEFARLVEVGPGVEFHASSPTSFDPASPEIATLRADLMQRCEAGGYGVGIMAVTPGG